MMRTTLMRMARAPESPSGKPRERLVQFRVTPGEHAELRRLARSRGVTVSGMFRQAVALYAAGPGGPPPPPSVDVTLREMCAAAGVSTEEAARLFEVLTDVFRQRSRPFGRPRGRTVR